MKLLAILIALSFFTSPFRASADTSTREFVMSCTYGAAAGTLVGAASLAFTSQPGENLNRVARGASIGLYVGILLGLYVVYIVPGLDSKPEEDPLARAERFPLMVMPTLGMNNRIDGAKADWTLLHF